MIRYTGGTFYQHQGVSFTRFSNTIKNGEDFKFMIELKGHSFKDAYVRICDFDENYNLLPNAKYCDTFNMENLKVYLSYDKNKYSFGVNYIRGFIVNLDRLPLENKKTDTQKHLEVYFTDSFYVIP